MGNSISHADGSPGNELADCDQAPGPFLKIADDFVAHKMPDSCTLKFEVQIRKLHLGAMHGDLAPDTTLHVAWSLFVCLLVHGFRKPWIEASPY